MDTNPRDYAGGYFRTVHERYQEYREAARSDHKQAVMRYYTPAGDEIRVAHVTLDERYGTLLIRGADIENKPCDVITSPLSAQIVLRLLPREAATAEPDRRPIGFTPAQQ